jgi:predicted RecB family nuclease
MASAALPPLSKSRFVAGWQCHKLLWWKVCEPDAPELVPDKVLQDRFDQGRQVTERARERFPGATLIPYGAEDSRIEATRLAMDFATPTILEGAFRADGVFAAADVLLRETDGYTLIEVKSSSALKDDHIVDAAIQTHVLRRSGVAVQRVAIMHLNKAFRHPDQGDMFVCEDVTAEVEALLPGVPHRIDAQRTMLASRVPHVAIGLHCFEPRDCPFHDRCWPADPNHIARLYNNGPKRACQYLEQGIGSVLEIPEGQKLPDAARRQLRALREGRMIVEPGLRRALDDALGEARLGYLDFETIQRAVPAWDGTGPWQQVVVQFSYHEQPHPTNPSRGQNQPHPLTPSPSRETGDLGMRHVGYLAEGPGDPRHELVERMLEATRGAERIVMYTPFERTRINELAQQVPAFADDLRALAGKLVDLHPIVRDYVYHPDFRGSFSLKAILHPLVPDLSYNDLAVVDGQVASVEIARLLFVAHVVEDRDRLRRELSAYCERDTWALVRLVERLRELAR